MESRCSGSDSESCGGHDHDEPVCWLCLKPDALSKRISSLPFHKECWNACRARTAVLKEACDPADKDVVLDRQNKEMSDNAASWRKKTRPFLEKGRQRKSARDNTKDEALQSVRKTEHVNGELALDDDLILTKSGYKKFRQEESEVDSDQCNDDFEDSLCENDLVLVCLAVFAWQCLLCLALLSIALFSIALPSNVCFAMIGLALLA